MKHNSSEDANESERQGVSAQVQKQNGTAPNIQDSLASQAHKKLQTCHLAILKFSWGADACSRRIGRHIENVSNGKSWIIRVHLGALSWVLEAAKRMEASRGSAEVARPSSSSCLRKAKDLPAETGLLGFMHRAVATSRFFQVVILAHAQGSVATRCSCKAGSLYYSGNRERSRWRHNAHVRCLSGRILNVNRIQELDTLYESAVQWVSHCM